MRQILNAIFDGPMLTYWPTIRRCLMVVGWAVLTVILAAAADTVLTDMHTEILSLKLDVAHIKGASKPLVIGSDGTTVNFWLDGEKKGE